MPSPEETPDEEAVQYADPLTGEPLRPPEPEPARDEPEPEPPAPFPPPTRWQVGVTAMLVLLAVTVLVISRTGPTSSAPPVATGGAEYPGYSLTTTPPRQPQIASWQPVWSDQDSLLFDVPPDWTVEKPSVAISYAAPNGRFVTMHGIARYRSDFCAAMEVSARGQAGFATLDAAEATDVSAAALVTARQWAVAGYSAADGSDEPGFDVVAKTTVPVFGGALRAAQVTATVHAAEPTACSPPSLSIVAVALPLDADPSGDVYHVFVALLDREVPDAVPDDVTARIVGTIRD